MKRLEFSLEAFGLRETDDFRPIHLFLFVSRSLTDQEKQLVSLRKAQRKSLSARLKDSNQAFLFFVLDLCHAAWSDGLFTCICKCTFLDKKTTTTTSLRVLNLNLWLLILKYLAQQIYVFHYFKDLFSF